MFILNNSKSTLSSHRYNNTLTSKKKKKTFPSRHFYTLIPGLRTFIFVVVSLQLNLNKKHFTAFLGFRVRQHVCVCVLVSNFLELGLFFFVSFPGFRLINSYFGSYTYKKKQNRRIAAELFQLH